MTYANQVDRAMAAALERLLPVIRTRIGAVSPQDIAVMRTALGLPALDDDTLQAQADEAQRVALRASILPRGERERDTFRAGPGAHTYQPGDKA